MGLLTGYLAPGRGKVITEPVIAGEKVDEPEPVAPKKNNRISTFITPDNTGTAWAPRPALLYPSGDFRNNDPEEIRDLKCDVMVNWLYQQQMEMLWTAGGQDEGVVLKKTRGQYTCCPSDIVEEPYGFFKAVQTLNVRVSTFSVSY